MFRREAIAHQQDRLLGDVLSTGLPRLGWWVGAACLVPVALLAFGIWGQYTRKEHVSGYLAPSAGLIKVQTPQAGTVSRAPIREGQTVQKGDVLLVLNSERHNSTTQDVQAALQHEVSRRRDSLQQELNNQSTIDAMATQALAQRIQGLQAQVEQAQQQIGLQRSRVASAERTIVRNESLVAAQFISDAALQQKQEDLTDQRSQLVNLQRGLTALHSDLATARTDLAASGLKRSNNSAAFQRQMSELAQQLTEGDSRRSVVITAPADGTLTTILTGVGQVVQPGMPLLTLLPAGAALEAQLLVPTRAAGFIQSGQTVALRYQAFPYQRFGHYTGQVSQIGRTVIQANESSLPVPVGEPVYRVTVQLPSQQVKAYGQAMALQAGMVVDADVWIDRRSILEWLFDPLLSVIGKV